MSKDPDAEENPSWLDSEQDEHHRQEIEPLLFGAGAVNFADPEEDGDTDEEHDNSNLHHSDDDDDDLETAVLTTGSGASSSKKSDYGSTASTGSKTTPRSTPQTSKTKLQKATKNKLWPFLGGGGGNGRRRKGASSTRPDDPWPTAPPTRVSFNERTGRPERPVPGCCLAIFYFVETYAILTCLCLLISQTLPLILIPARDIEPVDLVLKIYISIFSILFMVVEWDVNIPFIRNAIFLQTYVSRGFLYSFLGLTCLEEAYSERVNDMLAHANEKFHVAWFALFLQVSAWSLCVLGVLYFVMGVFCLKRLRDKYVKDDRTKWKEYREALKEWQRTSVHE